MNMPPIEEDAFKWLQDYIKPNMIVFEYGSGNSTLYFGDTVDLIVSIEHSSGKFYIMEEFVKRVKYNFIYKLIQPIEDPKPFPYSHLSYGSSHKNYLYHSFKDYVNYINTYSDSFFDIILINGMSRASCIAASRPKIKKDGIIIVNDSERYVYQDALKLFLNKYPLNHFGKKIRRTTIYEIRYPLS